jgi:GNAT superfamily N-acetyltransferase
MLAVHRTADASVAHRAAQAYLEARPARHNIVLTLLDERLRGPQAGRYWWVTCHEHVVGLAMQSPPTFHAAVLPTDLSALGVIGEVDVAAAFAGGWTERAGVGARPHEGQRLYALGELVRPSQVAGTLAAASAEDLPLLRRWVTAFHADTAMDPVGDAGGWLPGYLADGGLWVWRRDGAPVAMARTTRPVAGMSRIGFVYTPPAHRRRGYAAALVAAVSQHLRDAGVEECVLYTQLSNPTSNGVYRHIGFRAVAEVVRYDFDPA